MKDGDSKKDGNENSYCVPSTCHFVKEIQKPTHFLFYVGGEHGNMMTFHEYFYYLYSSNPSNTKL
jgi:hypothetical protein